MKIVKNLKFVFAGVGALALSACSSITNLSPTQVPQNPSNVYTLTMSAYISDGAIVKDSIEPIIVIDEQEQRMSEVTSRESERMFEYEYKLPANRTGAKYYYIVRYKSDTGYGGVVTREIVSPTVYELKPAARYVLNMSFDRGPIGTEVTVLGRGFNSQDKVKFGNIYADVVTVSRDYIRFIVPPLPAGKSYNVQIESGAGISPVGIFRVDPSEITSSYENIELASGDTIQVIFDIGFLAPEGGYTIDIQTNIPSSVIMPEVVVKPNESRAIVAIKGGSAGEGKLFVNSLGFKEKVIPIVVTPPNLAGQSAIEKVQDKVKELSGK